MAVMLLAAWQGFAADASQVQNLRQLSLEELMDLKVTSVTRKEQKLSRTAAAVFVITREDIRRSGATNIPDLFRMAPGVNVARINASSWAISIRGFNERYSGKVLVLIDGRSVYSQEFSGVYWDQQSVPLEDIDRIEITRGPGGTAWGANAVNGVINIITRHSDETQGGLVSMGTGSEDSAQTLLRYGGKAGSRGTYRLFGKYFNVENSLRGDGSTAGDGWFGAQGGFRSDWTLSDRDTLTVQGDLYRSRGGQTLRMPRAADFWRASILEDKVNVESGNILGRWMRTLANGSEATVQAFFSKAARLDVGQHDTSTADVDFQYHFRPHRRHDIVAGAGYRFNNLVFGEHEILSYSKPRLSSNLLNTFVQDEIALTNDLFLTVGSKFEHNSFTGFEVEPGAQLLWSPNEGKVLWFSATRTIRQPSWIFSNAQLNVGTIPLPDSNTAIYRLIGNPAGSPERLFNLEAGYRTGVTKRVTLDFTAFRSYYDRLFTVESGAPFLQLTPPPPHLVIPGIWDNLGNARNFGVEVFAHWQATSRLRLSPGFSYLRLRIFPDPGSTDINSRYYAGNSPRYQASLRSTLNLRRNIEWDTSAYFVSALNVFPAALPTIPIRPYTRLDTRIGWKVGEYTEFSLVGQNLLSPSRAEYAGAYQLETTQVQRSIFGKLTWRF